jgi:hypothetical protein
MQLALSRTVQILQNQGQARVTRHRKGREGPRVRLGPPRLERRLLRFLLLSVVGRVMDDLVHEEEVRVARLDRRIAWETEDWAVPCARIGPPFHLVFLRMFWYWGFLSRVCAQRTAEGGGSLMIW